MDYLGATLEIKAVQASQRIISGYAAGIGNRDRVQDVILPGAFTKTLAHRAPADVAVFIGHKQDSLPVGIPLVIRETPQGLYTETRIKPGPVGDDLLATAEFLQRHGRALGMSIGYRVPPGGAKLAPRGGQMVRELTEVDLFEYSFAAEQSIANPAALVSSVKQAEGSMPYRVEERDGEYCVVNPDSGRTHGCHPTKSAAEAQMRALYANVPDAGKTAPPWDAAYLAALPDSAYLWVEPGEQEAGRTVPQSKRHLAYRDAEGKVALDRLEGVAEAALASSMDTHTRHTVIGRARHLQACGADEAKLAAADTAEWRQGYPPQLACLGYMLVDLAGELAEQHKAMACLGQDTKAGRRMSAMMREKLAAVRQALADMEAWAEYADKGQDGAAKVARLRHEWALLTLADLATAGAA